MTLRITPYLLIRKVDKCIRIKIGRLNIYLSPYALSLNDNREKSHHKKKRRKLREMLLAERGFCQHCGKPLDWHTASIHHIVPKHIDRSREFDPNNLMLLCAPCHARLHQMEDLKAKALLCSQ